jgi:hypothetical protein
MSEPSTAVLLNHLLAIITRSFPQYLQFSRPYVPPGRSDLVEAVHSIVVDQNGLADRISQMLIDSHSPLRSGEFPMEFTDLHDLEIGFLIGLAFDYQRQDIKKIEELVEQAQMAPAVKSLTEEALGLTKGHLDSLQEMLAENSKT